MSRRRPAWRNAIARSSTSCCSAISSIPSYSRGIEQGRVGFPEYPALISRPPTVALLEGNRSDLRVSLPRDNKIAQVFNTVVQTLPVTVAKKRQAVRRRSPVFASKQLIIQQKHLWHVPCKLST